MKQNLHENNEIYECAFLMQLPTAASDDADFYSIAGCFAFLSHAYHITLQNNANFLRFLVCEFFALFFVTKFK